MQKLEETEISQAIISRYHQRLSERIVNDVLIVGAGPSGLTAALHLARAGRKVTVFEKRLSPGGGVWGGGMAMPEVVVQEQVLPLLDDIGVRHAGWRGGLYTVDAIELAAALTVQAIRAGAGLLNLITAEDVCVRGERVVGVVANRSMIAEALPIDPLTFSAPAVIDASGHEAVVVATLRKRGLLPKSVDGRPLGEGPMDAASGEAFVVDNVAEVFPGLWVCGMSVCAALGGPRMGPIFGGMLLSGQRVAEMVLGALGAPLASRGPA